MAFFFFNTMELITKIITLFTFLVFGGLSSLVIYFFTNTLIKKEKSKQQILESENKFRSLFQAINDAIIVFDPETLEIKEANAQATSIFGYSDINLVNKSVLDLYPYLDSVQIKRIFYERIKQESSNNINDEICRLDMKKIAINLKVSKVSFGKKHYLIALYRDMSEIQHAKKEIAEKMCELNSLIEFLSGREIKMIELKKEINNLRIKMGKKEKYRIPSPV